jgi:hypothetical protein
MTALLVSTVMLSATVSRGQQGGGGAPAKDPLAGLQIREVRWQMLPPEIEMACIGPDQRTWLVTTAPEKMPDVAAIKAEIATQWARPLPILHGARPALFEKSGRAWFISRDAKTLLAYNGKEWIEQAAHPSASRPQPALRGPGAAMFVSGFIGNLPGHGRVASVPVNLDLGKYLIFPESSGFSTFDGKAFSFLPMSPVNATNVLQLLPERSATGETGTAIGFQSRPVKLMRFRAGEWSAVPVPGPAGSAGVSWLALDHDGSAIIQRQVGGALKVHLTDPDSGTFEKVFYAHLNKIDNADSKVADDAAQAIADMGPAVVPLVRKILANVVDPGAEVRLRRVLDQLSVEPETSGRGGRVGPARGGGRGVAGTTPLKIGDLDLTGAQAAVFYDPSGMLLVSARNIPPEVAPETSGMFLCLPDGTHRFAPGQYQTGLSFSSPVPYMASGGKTVVLRGAGGVTRVDFSSNPPKVNPFGQSYFGFVQALAGNGTCFFSTIPPLMLNESANRNASAVLVYKPGAPDDRQVLATESRAMSEIALAVAQTGDLFSSGPDGEVVRYDSSSWKTVVDRPYRGTELFTGNNGELLVWQGKSFTFIKGDQQFQGTALDEFVRQHAVDFASAFRGPQDPALFRRTLNRSVENAADPAGTPTEGGWSIAADRNGCLWLAISRTLRVLPRPQGDWLSVDWPADSNTLGPSLLLPVGDGSSVYVYGTRTGNAAPSSGPNAPGDPKAYLASFKNGQMEFSPAPCPRNPDFFMDAEHALWTIDSLPRTSERPRVAYRVRRVGSQGPIDDFQIDGKPVLLDRSGIVWLSGENDTLQLWKEGKTIGSINVPYGRASHLFSDKPGSVWVWTPLDLRHFTSSAAKPADYQLQGRYAVEADGIPLFGTGPADAGVSSKGFLFTTTRVVSGSGDSAMLHTVHLPSQ